MPDELTEEQAAEEAKLTKGDVDAAMKSIAEKAYEAGRQAAIEDEQGGEETFTYNSNRGVSKIVEKGYAAYESELQAKVTELKMAGSRGSLKNHPDVVEIRNRHGR